MIGLFGFNPFIAVHYPANIYLFKVNNRNTRKRCEICSTLTIKTPQDIIDICSKLAKQSQCIVFIVNFGHLLRMYLLLQNFPKFTRKHLRCSTLLVKLPGHPENLAKCFLKPILRNILKQKSTKSCFYTFFMKPETLHYIKHARTRVFTGPYSALIRENTSQ